MGNNMLSNRIKRPEKDRFLSLSDNKLMEEKKILALENETLKQQVRKLELKFSNTGIDDSEAQYKTIFQNTNEAIIVVQDSILLSPNPAAELLFEKPKEMLENKPFIDLIYKDDRAMINDRHKKRIQGNNNLPSIYPVRITRKKGGNQMGRNESSTV